MALPRVLILYTGGTFGMDLNLAVPKLSSKILKKRFLLRVPELQELAQCDVEILLNRDSAHIGPEEWLLFATKIQDQWSRYDGIVLLHGTDTMAFTASALSFLLRPCLKPVVITGAQRPLMALRTDARTNLISAVEIAAHGPRKLVSQVTVFFGDQLFQGNRIRKRSATDFAAFESPTASPLATVGTTIRYRVGQATLNRLKLKPIFARNVLVSHLTPGFPSECFTSDLLSHLEGIVLVVFHSGTAPTHDRKFLNFLERAQKLQIPVTLTTDGATQAPHIERSPPSYAAGKELFSYGCFWGGNMTPECTYVKTSLILGQLQGQKTGDTRVRNFKEFARFWKEGFADEG